MAKDANFWSARVSRDIRLILHRAESSLLLCYVDHHDAAYRWAERRVLERHPRTGAAQLVEVRETVRDIEVPRYVEAQSLHPNSPHTSDGNARCPRRLGQSRPPGSRRSSPTSAGTRCSTTACHSSWLDEVHAATEDGLSSTSLDHLPTEAAEALLELATGGTPARPVQTDPDIDPFAHPDAQRRFRVMANVEELERALEYPWEKWTVFLHPTQRDLVERRYNGPARVAGSAGTGKTVVALHRAVHLARAHPRANVLLTTFSDTLARALGRKLELLVGNEPRGAAPHPRRRDRPHRPRGLSRRARTRGACRPRSRSRRVGAAPRQRRSRTASAHASSRPSGATWWTHGSSTTWDAYRDVARLGRKTRLREPQRALLWSIFERVRADLDARGLVTIPGVFAAATEHVASGHERPFDYVVVDEAQDIGVPQLRFLAALNGEREDGLFFAGDLGQRIFQTPFSWRSLGVDVRGRSHTLRINYRTSHQIRRQADLLLGPELADVDGNVEDRRGTISAFNGPPPTVEVLDSTRPSASDRQRGSSARRADGIAPRRDRQSSSAPRPSSTRASDAVRAAGLEPAILDGDADAIAGAVAVGTMHLAKGLEFRAVVVAACDDEVIPSLARIENVADDADLEDVYDTERQLLYVACTRARDHLLVTGVAPASEFLDDLRRRPERAGTTTTDTMAASSLGWPGPTIFGVAVGVLGSRGALPHGAARLLGHVLRHELDSVSAGRCCWSCPRHRCVGSSAFAPREKLLHRSLSLRGGVRDLLTGLKARDWDCRERGDVCARSHAQLKRERSR